MRFSLMSLLSSVVVAAVLCAEYPFAYQQPTVWACSGEGCVGLNPQWRVTGGGLAAGGELLALAVYGSWRGLSRRW